MGCVGSNQRRKYEAPAYYQYDKDDTAMPIQVFEPDRPAVN